jgi:hypothetical protein
LNGESLGIATWHLSALSPRWLEFGREILRNGGGTFDRSLPVPFERVRLRFTSASTAALATFFLDAWLATSSVFLRGDDPTVERELLKMFVQSVQRSEAVRQSQTTSEPLAQAFSILERPLHLVVAWGTEQQEDGKMISELSAHLAGAFLLGQNPV